MVLSGIFCLGWFWGNKCKMFDKHYTMWLLTGWFKSLNDITRSSICRFALLWISLCHSKCIFVINMNMNMIQVHFYHITSESHKFKLPSFPAQNQTSRSTMIKTKSYKISSSCEKKCKKSEKGLRRLRGFLIEKLTKHGNVQKSVTGGNGFSFTLGICCIFSQPTQPTVRSLCGDTTIWWIISLRPTKDIPRHSVSLLAPHS